MGSPMRWVVEIEAGAALLFVYLANAQLRAPLFPGCLGGAEPSVDLSDRIGSQDWPHLMRQKTAVSISTFYSLILSDKNLCAINPARENFIASLFYG